jgi:hypothetical protein
MGCAHGDFVASADFVGGSALFRASPGLAALGTRTDLGPHRNTRGRCARHPHWSATP